MKKTLYDDSLSDRFGNPNALGSGKSIFEIYSAKKSKGNPKYASDERDSDETPSITDTTVNYVGSDNATEPSGEKTKKHKWISKLIACAVLVAGASGIMLFFSTYVILGDIFGNHMLISRDTVSVDLSGTDLSSYAGLSKLDKLESVDLTNTSFEDLSVLYGCKDLRRVVMKDKVVPAEDCLLFREKNPKVCLDCKIELNGNIYETDTPEITVNDADTNTQLLYAAVTGLKTLNLTGCDVQNDTFKKLASVLPDCLIICNTEVNGKTYRTDAESIAITNEINQSDLELLVYFRNLVMLDLTKCTNIDAAEEFPNKRPDVEVIKELKFLQKTVTTRDELIDLRGKKYTQDEVRTALNEALPQMKRLKKIDMCGCGLSNEEMAELGKEFPNIKFVWIIHLAHWDVRTDAVIFSSLNGMHFSKESVYEPLFTYCTDLIALDLGHNLMRNISKISSLKKLRAAILMDNKFTDISPLAELKEIEFLEMNINRIESIEPLRNLDNLMYIDLWSSMGITDLSPLYDHEKLKIAIFHKTISGDERVAFKKHNPNCKTFYQVDSVNVTTNAEWRQTKYRRKLKEAFTNWKYIVGYNEETGEFIYDRNTDQYDYM